MKNYYIFKSSRSQVFDKKVCVKNFVKFTGKHLCQGFFLVKLKQSYPQIYLKKTPAQVFSSEFCAIFKGATKLYFTHYSCMVIILFSTGLGKSAFSTYLLENQSHTHTQTHTYLKIHEIRNVTFLSVLCCQFK